MVDSRKWFLALALIALTIGTASAQPVPAFQCVANAGVPPIVRAEGIAELLGDIVLNCNGGTPGTFQQVNFQVFLNTNVTSKLLADPWTEALLLIDEPAGTVADPQSACKASSGVCTPSGAFIPAVNPAQTYKLAGAQPPSAGAAAAFAPNVYQGRTNGKNSIVWLGVPIEAPGTTFTRIIRITNLRGNANQLGVSSTLVPNPIVAYISATGTTSVPINNPQQTIAFIQNGLSFSLRKANGDSGGASDWAKSQCSDNNKDLATDPTKDGCIDFRLRYSEGFASSFKTQGGAGQNTPGVIYNTESGFVNSALVGHSDRGNLGIAGAATQGTRLRAVFNSVPQGVRLYVTLKPVGSSGTTDATLINAAVDGSGAFSATPKSSTTKSDCSSAANADFAEVPLFGGSGTAVWEVVGADPFAIGRVEFGVIIAYAKNTPNNLPGLGSATVNGMFAPVSTVTDASAIAPVPRFADTSSAVTAFTISACETNLLFPFVANSAGFDTGLVISNTSKDIFSSNNAQAGACTLNYYGDTNGGAAPPAQTSGTVPAGDYLAWTLSGGGKFGVTATPGFTGYIIAKCKFQYAHGFAFISDVGAQKLSHGYLALIIDEAVKRGSVSTKSESLGQ